MNSSIEGEVPGRGENQNDRGTGRQERMNNIYVPKWLLWGRLRGGEIAGGVHSLM